MISMFSFSETYLFIFWNLPVKLYFSSSILKENTLVMKHVHTDLKPNIRKQVLAVKLHLYGLLLINNQPPYINTS